MVQPTALNILIIGLSMVVFVFLWRRASEALVDRNPDSSIGKAMGIAL